MNEETKAEEQPEKVPVPRLRKFLHLKPTDDPSVYHLMSDHDTNYRVKVKILEVEDPSAPADKPQQFRDAKESLPADEGAGEPGALQGGQTSDSDPDPDTETDSDPDPD